jgi:hypothetical protein
MVYLLVLQDVSLSEKAILHHLWRAMTYLLLGWMACQDDDGCGEVARRLLSSRPGQNKRLAYSSQYSKFGFVVQQKL